MRLLVIGLDRDVAKPDSRSAQRQLEYFRDQDADIIILAEGEPRRVILSERVTAHVAGGGNRAMAWFRTIRLARCLLKKCAYDVLTVQDPFFSGLAGALARWGLPTRLHVQDHSGAFAREPLGAKEQVLFLVSRFIARSADRVRTVSKRGAEGLKRFGLDASHVDIVPVASDASRFSLIASKTTLGAHLVCVSRLSFEKGVDVLLQAMPRIREAMPQARLTVVGDGPERPVLENLASKLGISDIVRFAGNQHDTAPFIADADVYVQPSRFEGWGIAVIEAAAAGRPIVMTDVGCAGEVVVNGESGRVRPPQDPDEIATAVIRLLKDSVLASKLGARAREAAGHVPNAATFMDRLRLSLRTTADMGPRDTDNGLPVFATAFAVRLAIIGAIVYFAGEKGLQFPDTESYLPLAQNLLAGNGFTIDGGAYIYRTIGYPLFLAGALGVFRSLVLVSILQAFISSFAPSLVMAIGRRLNLPAKTRRAAGWLTACEPHLVFYALPILTEGVFVIPFLGLVYFVIRFIQDRRMAWAVYAGILLGVTLLFKPLLQAYPVFLALLLAFAFVKRDASAKAWAKGSVLCLLVGILVALPWAYRNHREFGVWSLSDQGQAAMATYLAPSIISVRDRISYQDAETKARNAFEAQYGKTVLEGRDLSKEFMAYALGVIKENPLIFARIAATASVSYWTSHNYAYIPHYYGLTPPIDHSILPPTHYLVQGRFGDFFREFGKIFGQPFYLVGGLGRALWAAVTLLMLVGIYRALRRGPERAAHLFVVSLLVYATAMTMVNGLGVEGRLRYHLMPLIFLYAAYGWTAKRRLKEGEKMRLLVVTQRVDANDTNIGNHVSWLREIASHATYVTVIAQAVGEYDLPTNVRVISLGKEKGAPKLLQLARLKWHVFRELFRHDAVLVLMVAWYAALAGWYGMFLRKPVYLWYTHKHVPLALKVANVFVKRIFTASSASLRLETNKKMVMGHAIDTDLFSPGGQREPGLVVTVGRLSRSKRVEDIIDAVAVLPTPAHLDIIGAAVAEDDKAYAEELAKIAAERGRGKTGLAGGLPYARVAGVYRRASVFVNVSATGSMDKAVLEAMACGCPVVVSNEAFKDIVPAGCFVPAGDAQALAEAIRRQLEHPTSADELRGRVVGTHDLHRTLGNLMDQIKKDISV